MSNEPLEAEVVVEEDIQLGLTFFLQQTGTTIPSSVQSHIDISTIRVNDKVRTISKQGA